MTATDSTIQKAITEEEIESPEGSSDRLAQIYEGAPMGLAEFLEAGGVIHELPPAPAPRKRLNKKSMKEDVKVSQYVRIRPPKGEAMLMRLNVSSQDFTLMTSATRINPLTSGQIHAALANKGMKQSEEYFLLYVFTEDQRWRSGAWSLLLDRLADDCIRENWNVKKRGTMQAVADTALLNFMRPAEFHGISDRAWARHLKLESHRDWPRIWRRRYTALMNIGELVIENGLNIIARGV